MSIDHYVTSGLRVSSLDFVGAWRPGGPPGTCEFFMGPGSPGGSSIGAAEIRVPKQESFHLHQNCPLVGLSRTED